MAINFMFMANDVDGENQVKFPYYFDGDVDHAKEIVMFIGNSITYHELKPEIGWNQQNGMAASDLEHDYVHIVLKELRKKEPNTAAIVFNGGNWEMDFINPSKLETILKVAREYKPNLIISRIGENTNKRYLKDNIDPTPYYDNYIKGLVDVSKNVITTSLFWEFPLIDNMLKKLADKYNTKYVKIYDLGYDDENKAIGLYEHNGVAGHPGNLGMKRIAERILKAI